MPPPPSQTAGTIASSEAVVVPLQTVGAIASPPERTGKGPYDDAPKDNLLLILQGRGISVVKKTSKKKIIRFLKGNDECCKEKETFELAVGPVQIYLVRMQYTFDKARAAGLVWHAPFTLTDIQVILQDMPYPIKKLLESTKQLD